MSVKSVTIIAIFSLFLLLGCKKSSGIFPEKKSIIESVYATATIKPDSLYAVYSSVVGIVDDIFLEEGSLVQKETPILKITNTASQFNLNNAALSLTLAQENFKGQNALLKDIETELKTAQLKYSNDSVNYFRQKRLWENKIGSQLEYETKKLAYETSLNTLKNIKEKYGRSKTQLDIQLKQAQNNYRNSVSMVNDYVIKSKINGKIYSILKKRGEIVNLQEPIATIGSANRFIIELLINEKDISKLKIGQDVIVTLDAYPNQTFGAHITKLYPQKDSKNLTFKAEAEFKNRPQTLYSGLSGEANIIINKKTNVLVIPINYLIEDNKVKTKNGLTEVKTGLKSLDMIEIISGIDEKTELFLPE